MVLKEAGSLGNDPGGGMKEVEGSSCDPGVTVALGNSPEGLEEGELTDFIKGLRSWKNTTTEKACWWQSGFQSPPVGLYYRCSLPELIAIDLVDSCKAKLSMSV